VAFLATNPTQITTSESLYANHPDIIKIITWWNESMLKENNNLVIIAKISANPLQHVHADTGLAALLLMDVEVANQFIVPCSLKFEKFTVTTIVSN